MSHATKEEQELWDEVKTKLEKTPNDIQVLILAGFLMIEPFHDCESAKYYFKKVIELDPNNVDARFWIAEALYHEYADAEGAKPVLEEALKLNPNRADCLDLMVAVMIEMKKKPKDYIHYVERAVELEPSWVNPRSALARELFEMGKYDEAEQHAKKALSCLGSVKLPSDPIGEYYESVVTGRAEATKASRWWLDKLIDDIHRAQGRST